MTISLEGIQKIYPSGFQAVNNLDLRIENGEFFTLLGPSGCGKTTTLRMIAGLETASRGRILIGERDFTNTHPRDRDVAMVFQSYALYPHMTVRQNLALNLEVKRNPRAEIDKRVAEVSRMLGIDKLLDSKPGQLSGGQRQRVALGRALIRRPNVFLMDEPLSNLDLKLRERTRTELKKLHERLRVTTVYVTHDQAEALVLSDRIGIMNAGDLLRSARPRKSTTGPPTSSSPNSSAPPRSISWPSALPRTAASSGWPSAAPAGRSAERFSMRRRTSWPASARRKAGSPSASGPRPSACRTSPNPAASPRASRSSSRWGR